MMQQLQQTVEFGERRSGGWRRGSALLIVLLLVLSACGSSDDNADGNTGFGDAFENNDSNDGDESPDPPPDPPSFGGGDFCDTMREFDEDDPLDGFSVFSEDYYDAVLSLMNQTIDRAPGEIKGSFETLRDGFETMRDTVTADDFNIMDPANAELFEALESEEMIQAGEDIDRYLEEECGIENGFSGVDSGGSDVPGLPAIDPEDFADIDDMDAAQFYEAILGVDSETAECLANELGDFDDVGDDPSLFTQEFCGMTFMELLAQMGRGQ